MGPDTEDINRQHSGSAEMPGELQICNHESRQDSGWQSSAVSFLSWKAELDRRGSLQPPAPNSFRQRATVNGGLGPQPKAFGLERSKSQCRERNKHSLSTLCAKTPSKGSKRCYFNAYNNLIK